MKYIDHIDAPERMKPFTFFNMSMDQKMAHKLMENCHLPSDEPSTIIRQSSHDNPWRNINK